MFTDETRMFAIGWVAEASLEIQDYEHAARMFEMATLVYSEDAQSWRLMGHALVGESRFDEAIAAYHEAARLDPDDHRPWLSLAILYDDHLGEHGAAQEHYRTALERGADPDLINDYLAWAERQEARSGKLEDRRRLMDERKAGQP